MQSTGTYPSHFHIPLSLLVWHILLKCWHCYNPHRSHQMKILAQLHGSSDPSNQWLKHLIRFFSDVGEHIISAEASTCLLLHINMMKHLPQYHWIILQSLNVHVFPRLQSWSYKACYHLQNQIPCLLVCSCSWVLFLAVIYVVESEYKVILMIMKCIIGSHVMGVIIVQGLCGGIIWSITPVDTYL